MGKAVVPAFEYAPHSLIYCKFHWAFEIPGHITSWGLSVIEVNIMLSNSDEGMVRFYIKADKIRV